MSHLTALDGIATANGGNRAAGTPGYAASRDYLVGKLQAAGYSPVVQDFEFPYYKELSTAVMARTAPVATAYTAGTDFATMTYSGSGDVTAAVQGVDLTLPPTPAPSSNSGCEASDFAGFTPGNIALMQRGTCTFLTKAQNAEAAGASAVIIFNEGQPGRQGVVAGTLGQPGITIPVLGTSFAIGQSLAAAGTEVHVKTDTESSMKTTWNITAETKYGNPDNVVMAGAHLDSVQAGEGINDNGSGSAALLTLAEKMIKVEVANKVRFAWWGAEELGLLGSEHYVADMVENNPGDFAKIALYLNFDMIGSPNAVNFVYDGDGSAFPNQGETPEGSAAIEQDFHDYFAAVGVSSAETEFSGRSDYGPFIAEGVPAGGLFTGAEGVKTAAQAAIWGGEAGVAYDHCYHQACDDITNISTKAIDENSDAMAHLVLLYGYDTRSVNGTGTGTGLGHTKINPGQPSAPGAANGAGTDGGLHDDHEHDVRDYS